MSLPARPRVCLGCNSRAAVFGSVVLGINILLSYLVKNKYFRYLFNAFLLRSRCTFLYLHTPGQRWWIFDVWSVDVWCIWCMKRFFCFSLLSHVAPSKHKVEPENVRRACAGPRKNGRARASAKKVQSKKGRKNGIEHEHGSRRMRVMKSECNAAAWPRRGDDNNINFLFYGFSLCELRTEHELILAERCSSPSPLVRWKFFHRHFIYDTRLSLS